MLHPERIDLNAATTRLDRRLAAPMCAGTLGFLALLAVTLYLRDTYFWDAYGPAVLLALAATYLIFPAEALAHALSGGRGLRQHVWHCLLPVSRLGARDHVSGRLIWLPIAHWRVVDRDLAYTLIRFFSIPMVLIALLVIPVVIGEIFFGESIAARPRLKLAFASVSALIWAAFVIEFTVVISVVRFRRRYCRRNWIDLAVILLPLLDFVQLAQMGQILALKQLTRTARLYRLRGVVIRGWRAVLTLDVIDRLLRRAPEDRLERLRFRLAEQQEEMDLTLEEIGRLEAIVAERQRRRDAARNTPPSLDTRHVDAEP